MEAVRTVSSQQHDTSMQLNSLLRACTQKGVRPQLRPAAYPILSSLLL